uniref:Retrotransposon protein, putative, unclassified n=1 Tax=Oryza sativa subsp. japonica TaxID=39947 RepID=Q2QV23_ORYSJ|nr:retrotransposon protein, putative, unclassified [Oryza sativa Japonica Group]
MAEKPPPSPSSAREPDSVKAKILKLGLSEVDESNIMPITLDKLTPEQHKDLEAMMQQAKNQFLSSFTQTRKGTLVQKYKLMVVADVPGTGSSKDGELKQAPDGMAQPGDQGVANGSQGNQGDGFQEVQGLGSQGDNSQGLQGGNLSQNGNAAHELFNNFQDRVDYAVHNALINQSGVLVNTLSNMMKSMVDGSMAEYQATGPVYLQGGVFPDYRPLITNTQPSVQTVPPNAPSAQPTAPVSAPALAASTSAPGQLVSPRLLMREQPQHRGQDVNRLRKISPAAADSANTAKAAVCATSLANTPNPTGCATNSTDATKTAGFAVDSANAINATAELPELSGGQFELPISTSFAASSISAGGPTQSQFVLQYNQFEPKQQQSQGATQQRPWADVITDVMREQFGLKPKDAGNLYRQPYPEWFERVPLPNRFKVLDFSKFSGQDGVSTYEHISRFLAQCGEASAVDALRVRLFRLSLSGSAFTWFSSVPYGSINTWADLEKQFHSYFYSGVHEMKLSDLTAIKQRHDEPMHEYIQRFREMRNKCYSLNLTDAQLAVLAFQGMIAPIREIFSSEDFDSLSHLIQKVTLHEQRSAEARKNPKRVNHVCPYIYGSDNDDDDCEIAAAEWGVKNSRKEERQQILVAIEGGKIKFDDSKRPMKVDGNPFPVNMVHTAGRTANGGRTRGFQVNSAKIINKYQRKYDKQQERRYEEDNGGFDPHWGCELFRFCYNEGMRLPSIEDCPGCSNVAGRSSRSYDGGNRLKQTRVPIHQRLGPVNQDYSQKDDGDRKIQWCPSAEFEIKQTDVDKVEEESAKLVLSPEQAIFEKPEGTENRHAKPLYINGYVNGKPMSKMMIDGGAAKLGRNAEDLIKTNMVLKDFGGNPSETKGVLNVELTVGSTTIPTTFFVIDRKGSYNLLLGVRPHQQPPRRCKADMLEPVKAEIKRLYDAGFIRPCRYAEWVSSIVHVIKKNGNVRVCIDFRDLNKATPKDEYPMPVADQLVDAASGHKILSFMDGNVGYNQIFMAKEDIYKTAFRCPGAIGLFEWVVMTFGLKSAGATYQRAMNYIYHDLIGWLVEVYIDDVFLGFLVHERGIEITQRSVNAIKKIKPTENKTKLQEMIGKINFVRRFISNLSGRAPASAMNPIIKPWPFRGWGIDMIGMINPPSSKGHKFILVATDYFTKWIEAIPLKKVDSGDAIQFVQEHIIYRFGIPQTITTDQGSIFVSDEFVQFADSMGIKLLNSSPYYTQANGQAEASSKSMIKLIKRKISDYPRHWHTRLAEALWSYRMACHGSIQVPPYKLVYGHAAVLPWEVKIGSRRIELQDGLTADEYYNLMADEREDLVQSRLRALAKVTKDKERVARHYNKQVVPKTFSEGELVWKLILPIGTRDNKFGKWSPNWERPFQIYKVVSKGAYMLQGLHGEVYGRALNGKYLQKYYPSVWVNA